MIDITSLSDAMAMLFTSFGPWLYVVPGILIGLFFGAVPGMQISMAMAIFLPLSMLMDFLQAILFLTAIFTGGAFGGGISAILMNIPGSSSAVATAFDGYPMTRLGHHNRALGLALGASAVGCLVGYMILFFLIQPMSLAVLKLGPVEMVVIALWGLTLIATLRGKYILRGLLAGSFGLVLSCFGFSLTGVQRGTFGSIYLMDGISIVPAMIGLFAASELFNLTSSSYLVEDEDSREISLKSICRGVLESFKHPVVLVRGSLLGTLIGAVPGVGSSIANIVSYSETKRRSKNPEQFGQGEPAGVIAAESANSSSEGGAMAALLALGLPGGAATAVMLAAFNMHNITGGPRFIRDNTDIVYSIIIGNLVQVFLLLILGVLFIRLLTNIVKVPLVYMIPSVLSLATFGAYGITGTLAGPLTVFVFAFLGWLMTRNNYPVAATVIGLLLGGMMEGELVRSMQISGGQWGYVLHRPIAMVFLFLLVFCSVVQPLYQKFKRRQQV